MKNDSTTTFLNFVLAALVILGVLFALLSIYRVRDQRHLAAEMQFKLRNFQVATMRAQALLTDTMQYNATAKNPELTQIIQSVQAPARPAK